MLTWIAKLWCRTNVTLELGLLIGGLAALLGFLASLDGKRTERVERLLQLLSVPRRGARASRAAEAAVVLPRYFSAITHTLFFLHIFDVVWGLFGGLRELFWWWEYRVEGTLHVRGVRTVTRGVLQWPVVFVSVGFIVCLCMHSAAWWQSLILLSFIPAYYYFRRCASSIGRRNDMGRGWALIMRRLWGWGRPHSHDVAAGLTQALRSQDGNAPMGTDRQAVAFALCRISRQSCPTPFHGDELPMSGTDMSGLRITPNVNFEFADLYEAILTGANLGHARMKGVDLYGAKMQGTALERADLRNARLKDAKLAGAKLAGADFRGADLRGACLWNASFCDDGSGGADLRGADLRRADLTKADLREANLKGAWYSITTKVKEAILGKDKKAQEPKDLKALGAEPHTDEEER